MHCFIVAAGICMGIPFISDFVVICQSPSFVSADAPVIHTSEMITAREIHTFRSIYTSIVRIMTDHTCQFKKLTLITLLVKQNMIPVHHHP
jgi:hypothetical protein